VAVAAAAVTIADLRELHPKSMAASGSCLRKLATARFPVGDGVAIDAAVRAGVVSANIARPGAAAARAVAASRRRDRALGDIGEAVGVDAASFPGPPELGLAASRWRQPRVAGQMRPGCATGAASPRPARATTRRPCRHRDLRRGNGGPQPPQKPAGAEGRNVGAIACRDDPDKAPTDFTWSSDWVCGTASR
jgi:hypothetical protein